MSRGADTAFVTVPEPGAHGAEEEEGYDEEWVEDEDYTEEEVEEEESVDGEIEEADEEDEEDEEEGQAGEFIAGLGPLPAAAARGGRPRAAPAAVQAQPWNGLAQFPAATRSALHALLGQLQRAQRDSLTVLLLGKAGMGKSSTANSLTGETVAPVAAFQADQAGPQRIARTAQGFTLTFVDTPGLLESDTVSEAALAAIASEISGLVIDVVLYVDRLDVYRVEQTDKQVMEGITRYLGADIWNNTIIALTRGGMEHPPAGTTYDEYVQRRSEALRSAARKAGGASAALPVVLVENARGARTNAGGERVLPSGEPWLPAAFEQMVALATNGAPAYVYSSKASQKSNPNRRRKWLIPFILAAQIAFKVFVVDRVMEEDGLRGDATGPFSEEFVEEERARRQGSQAVSKRRQEQLRQQRQVAAAAAQQRAAAQRQTEPDDDDEEDEDTEEED